MEDWTKDKDTKGRLLGCLQPALYGVQAMVLVFLALFLGISLKKKGIRSWQTIVLLAGVGALLAVTGVQMGVCVGRGRRSSLFLLPFVVPFVILIAVVSPSFM